MTGWYDGWIVDREFAVDMAGFALNLGLLLNTSASMPYHAGYEEDKLLKALGVKMEEIEPLANDCTEVGHARSDTERRVLGWRSGEGEGRYCVMKKNACF